MNCGSIPAGNALKRPKQQSEKLNLDANECARRARLLEDLERNLEGFSQSVKLVMKEAKHGTLPGFMGRFPA